MADNQMLTDEQLMAVAKSGDSSLLRALTPQERDRMITLSQAPEQPPAPAPKWYQPGGDVILDTIRAAASLPRRALQFAGEHPAATGAAALSIPMSIATGGMAAAPAIALTGLAGAGGAGAGLATQQLTQPEKQPMPTVAGNVGQMAAQGAAAATGEGISRGIASATPRMARWLMTKALKPGEHGEQAVQTLLDEGVNVTPGGVAKLQQILGETNNQINTAVQAAGGDVSPLRVAGRLTDTARKFSQQVNPQADLEAISQVGENFLNHPNVTGPTMTVPQAQAMKVGTYSRLANKYGELGNATVEAEKGLARGLKEEVAAQVPGISDLNAREGRILNALEPLSRRVIVEARKDPVGLTWLTKNPATFLASLVDRNAAVKSMIARGLYSAAGAASGVPPQLIKTAVIAIASGTGDDAAPPAGAPKE